jgi:hypothetical protein
MSMLKKKRKSTLCIYDVTLLCRNDVHRLLSSSSLKLHQSSQSKMNRKDKKCFFYLVNCFVIQVVQPEGSRYIYIHTSNLKKEKTGIQLHVLYISYTYELIHVLYMYTLRKEWYFLVNYCSISHLDVENGFIFFR